MLKLFNILSLVIILANAAYGQDLPNKGDYVKDDSINKFVGTWEFKSETEFFQIKLMKERVNLKHVEADLIIGWHMYVKNGKVVETSLDKAFKSYETSTISGKSENPTRLSLTFKDINRNRTNHATLELIEGTSEKALWKLTLAEKITINKDGTTQGNITIPIPSEWILIKVE